MPCLIAPAAEDFNDKRTKRPPQAPASGQMCTHFLILHLTCQLSRAHLHQISRRLQRMHHRKVHSQGRIIDAVHEHVRQPERVKASLYIALRTRRCVGRTAHDDCPRGQLAECTRGRAASRRPAPCQRALTEPILDQKRWLVRPRGQQRTNIGRKARHRQSFQLAQQFFFRLASIRPAFDFFFAFLIFFSIFFSIFGSPPPPSEGPHPIPTDGASRRPIVRRPAGGDRNKPKQ